MNELAKILFDNIKNPEVLEAAASLAALMPDPEGPIASSVLRLAAAFARAGIKADQIDAIVAQYSAEAQTIAKDWV